MKFLREGKMKIRRVVLWGVCFALLAVLPGITQQALCKETDKEAIYKVVNKLEDYYERRKASKFIDLFSRRKFFNYIAFKKAVENDFDLYRNIQLKRLDERLYLSDVNAIYQAVWEKQYRSTLSSPLQRQRGLVRIMFEKYADRWWIVDLQGYPIFGSSEGLLADLTVTNVWIMGGGKRIVGVVKNIGNREAKSFYVGFYAGGTYLGKAFVAKMDKGDTQNISWVWTPDPSRRLTDIKVVADVSRKVKESREDNNVGKIPIKPGDTSYCADLAMTDRDLYVPSTVPAGSTVQINNTVSKAPKGNVKTVKAGDKLRICVTFRNIGGLSATGVTAKVYYVTEHPSQMVAIQQRSYPQVPKGAKVRFCFFWRVPELERKPSEKTKRYIRVILDPNNALPECSEANNAAEQEIAIVSSTGPYDGVLTVSEPAKAPNNDCPLSDVLTMTVTVEDQDLVNQNKVQVTIVSDIGNDTETFYLPKVSPGVFRGTAFASCKVLMTPTSGNGTVEVNQSGSGHVIVRYTDQRDSHGRTAVRSQRVRYIPW